MASLSFAEIYEKICEGLNQLPPRPLLLKALEKIEERISNKENVLLFLEAPTGYGKTTLSLSLYAAIKAGRHDLGQRVIHVLPMRSIGTDMRQKMIDRIRKLREHGINLDENDVGLQQMHSPGSPMLCKRFVITTLDTFISCFYKMPAAEISKIERYGTAHYEIPRACIYASIVVFDEFHLYTSAKTLIDGQSKSLTATVSCIRSLFETGVPVVISTATMPNCVKNVVKQQLELAGHGEKIDEITPSEHDRNFVRRNIRASVYKGELTELLNTLRQHRRILVLFNTVSHAVKNYLQLKSSGFEAILLHSRLIEKTKRERLAVLENGKRDNLILVSTQVLEAGVDKSFDVLVTEAATPDSIIQRAGRVARYGGDGYIFVTPITADGRAIYGEKLPAQVYQYISENRAIDQNMLGLIDESASDQLLDFSYKGLLQEVDSHPSYSVDYAQRVWRAVCGFVRDGEQVAVIPERYVQVDKRWDHLFCVDDEKFFNLYKQKIIQRALFEDGEVRKLGRIDESRCLSEQFFRLGVVAVVLDEYDEEVGLS
ncbi:MAG: CRISPR-associated helicase Cas3' [Candidatus Caldarchaeum sp.]|nr:CRISPR-associated helicase Cas3' [Candidatus Caldarchaeum sp.]